MTRQASDPAGNSGVFSSPRICRLSGLHAGEVYLHMDQELVILYVDEVKRQVTFITRVPPGGHYYYRGRRIKDPRHNTLPLAEVLDHIAKGFLKRIAL
jgi:hypothetical protein